MKKIEDMINQGWTHKEIAGEYGCSRSTITRRYNQYLENKPTAEPEIYKNSWIHKLKAKIRSIIRRLKWIKMI